MSFDVVVMGSGPGGYTAALRTAKLGMKTAIVERYPVLGGTCLNVGCIPSKALLESSERYHEAKSVFQQHGVIVESLRLDLPGMMRRKQSVVDMTTKGLDFLMKSNKIERFHGRGTLVDRETISVKADDASEKTLKTRFVILATGSKPASLPGVVIDKQRIVTSTEALSWEKVPGELIVIGAGAIGLELASVYARLGAKATVLEYLDSALPLMDRELGREITRVLKKELSLSIEVSSAVESASTENDRVEVVAKVKNGEARFAGDFCLVAVGRRANTEGLGLERLGITLDRGGRVSVNDKLQTSVENVYAIGDVIGGAMLAHKAEMEAEFVAETLAGKKPELRYETVPQVVYTSPEVAAVGSTEGQLKKAGTKYRAGKSFFRASGRARAFGNVEGFVKVLADESSDEILGVHMIGPRASDLIAEAVLAMVFKASAEDVARTCHAHPTFSETFKEACQALGV